MMIGGWMSQYGDWGIPDVTFLVILPLQSDAFAFMVSNFCNILPWTLPFGAAKADLICSRQISLACPEKSHQKRMAPCHGA
jgi:hypothetical protein